MTVTELIAAGGLIWLAGLVCALGLARTAAISDGVRRTAAHGRDEVAARRALRPTR